MKLNAIILAAGEGIRFRSINPAIPKPLFIVPGLNREILHDTISKLDLTNQFSQIRVVTGHLEEQVKEALDIWQGNIHTPIDTVSANPDYKKGPAYSFLSGLLDLPDGPTMLIPGDTLFAFEVLMDFFEGIRPDKGEYLAILSEPPSRTSNTLCKVDILTNRILWIKSGNHRGLKLQENIVWKTCGPLFYFTSKFRQWIKGKSEIQCSTVIHQITQFLMEDQRVFACLVDAGGIWDFDDRVEVEEWNSTIKAHPEQLKKYMFPASKS